MASTPTALDVRVFVPTKDFEHSLSFYQRVGWSLNWREGGLAEIELAGVRLLLQDFYAREWAENFMLHVWVDDVQAWYDHLVQVVASGEFPAARTAPPKSEPYGARVAYLWDPAGVLLHFAERTTGS